MLTWLLDNEVSTETSDRGPNAMKWAALEDTDFFYDSLLFTAIPTCLVLGRSLSGDTGHKRYHVWKFEEYG